MIWGVFMSTFNNLEEARDFFKGDRFATKNSMVLDELGDDYAKCSVILNEDHLNAYGGVMGGVIFTLADFAFAAASNNVHRPTVAQQVSINFLSSTKGKKLIAIAKCKKNGKTSAIYNIDVVDDLGREIAQFIGTGYKL